MKNINACISILSSRTKCLPYSIKSIWDSWNHRYNYPVYVYYFDDIYDDENLRNQIKIFTKSDIRFVSIPYETPEHISESELFYNRKDIQYVRTGFSIGRKGYLHMCHFYNNQYKYPNTEYDKYDYFLNIDDDAIFTKEIPYDFFEKFQKTGEVAGSIKVTNPKIKIPHQGVYDTRVGMVDFVLKYIKNNNLEPKCDFIKKLLDSPNQKEFFHKNLFVASSWLFQKNMFETPEWKQWSSAVNKNGGVYKYRWADCELIMLFLLIHHGELPYDFKVVEEGFHNQGGLRHIQNMAPSIKDVHK